MKSPFDLTDVLPIEATHLGAKLLLSPPKFLPPRPDRVTEKLGNRVGLSAPPRQALVIRGRTCRVKTRAERSKPQLDESRFFDFRLAPEIPVFGMTWN